MSTNTDIAIAKREIKKGEGIPAVAGKLTNRNPNKELDELIEIAEKAEQIVEGELDDVTTESERGGDVKSSTVDESGVEDAPEWFEMDDVESEAPDTEQLGSGDESPGKDSWSG